MLKIRYKSATRQRVIETEFHPCVVASFELSDATEFKRWLLGFGRHAVVQSPKAMADDIKAEYKAGCGAYGIRCNV